MNNTNKPLSPSEVPNTLRVDFGSHRMVVGNNGKTYLAVDVICPKCGKRKQVRVGSIRFRISHEGYGGYCNSCYPRHKPKSKGGVIINGGYRWLHKDLLDKKTLNALIVSKTPLSRRGKYIQEHRVVAFNKFGLVALSGGVIIRHLDGNKLNNSPENLALGTHQDNKDDHMTSIRDAARWRDIALTLFRMITGKG